MRTAKAAIFEGPMKPFAIREFPVVPPKPGEVGLTLLSSGVCGTDVHIHNGKLGSDVPALIGHEFVGRVDALGEGVTGLCPGDCVIADIALTCGHCLLCEEGDDANCLNLHCTNDGNPEEEPHFIGGYAEYLYHPAANCIRLPKELDPCMASVFACAGPTSLHAFRLGRQAGLDLSEIGVAVVQGLGPVGMFAVMALVKAGVKKVLAVSTGRNPARDARALDFGASEILSLKNGFEDVSRRVMELTDGRGADLVYEASGVPEAFNQGVDLLRNRGWYLVPGQYSSSGTIAFSPEKITFKALRILGSSQYSICDVEDYVAFLAAHPEVHAKIAALASRFPVSSANEAMEAAKSGSAIKVLLVPEA